MTKDLSLCFLLLSSAYFFLWLENYLSFWFHLLLSFFCFPTKKAKGKTEDKAMAKWPRIFRFDCHGFIFRFAFCFFHLHFFLWLENYLSCEYDLRKKGRCIYVGREFPTNFQKNEKENLFIYFASIFCICTGSLPWYAYAYKYNLLMNLSGFNFCSHFCFLQKNSFKDIHF